MPERLASAAEEAAAAAEAEATDATEAAEAGTVAAGGGGGGGAGTGLAARAAAEKPEPLRYIQMIDAGKKLVVSNCDGFLFSKILSLLHSIHLGPRTIWLLLVS